MGSKSIEIKQTTPVKCLGCGNDIFTQSFLIREVSAILSQDGQEAMLPIAIFVCDKCNRIADENLLKILEDEKTKIDVP